MILKVDDKDDVRERHFDGVAVTGTLVLTQKYYDPFTATEIDYQAGTGKEILCYLTVKHNGGAGTNADFKIWANTTKDSKSGGRDVLGLNYNVTFGATVTIPPFILQAGEYLNIERVSGSAAANIIASKIVGVERTST